jgi:hypothetical protein
MLAEIVQSMLNSRCVTMIARKTFGGLNRFGARGLVQAARGVVF